MPSPAKIHPGRQFCEAASRDWHLVIRPRRWLQETSTRGSGPSTLGWRLVTSHEDEHYTPGASAPVQLYNLKRVATRHGKWRSISSAVQWSAAENSPATTKKTVLATVDACVPLLCPSTTASLTAHITQAPTPRWQLLDQVKDTGPNYAGRSLFPC